MDDTRSAGTGGRMGDPWGRTGAGNAVGGNGGTGNHRDPVGGQVRSAMDGTDSGTGQGDARRHYRIVGCLAVVVTVCALFVACTTLAQDVAWWLR